MKLSVVLLLFCLGCVYHYPVSAFAGELTWGEISYSVEVQVIKEYPEPVIIRQIWGPTDLVITSVFFDCDRERYRAGKQSFFLRDQYGVPTPTLDYDDGVVRWKPVTSDPAGYISTGLTSSSERKEFLISIFNRICRE